MTSYIEDSAAVQVQKKQKIQKIQKIMEDEEESEDDDSVGSLVISWDGKSQNRNDWLDFFLSVARLRLGFGPSKG